MDLDIVTSPDGVDTIAAVPGGRAPYQSNVRAFVEYFLGEPIETYVARRRAEMPQPSWRDIAERMAQDIIATAARLDPNRPPLRIRIAHTLPFQIAAGEPGEPPEGE